MEAEVTLRDVSQEDLHVFYVQQLDPAATAMAAFPSRSEAAFMAHWHRIMTDGNVLLRTVLAGGDVAGNVVSFERSGEREIGYWLGRAFWGRGIATSALRAFLGVETRRPLTAHVAVHNVASRRVLEKCGFVVSGVAVAGTGPLDDDVEEVILRLR
jgi:RimJ/RimL family protein N-acetyltransferase